MDRPTWIARCAPGLQDLLARELRALGGGIGKTRVAPGEVRFEGPPDTALRANLRLRTADRVLRVVGEGEADRFDALSAWLFSLPWQDVLDRRVPVAPVVRHHGGKLWHSGAVEDAAVAALTSWGLTIATKETPRFVSVELSGEGARWTCAVDTTGVRLSRRGYRKDAGLAPLREDLAAAALIAVGWTAEEALLDPFCGSGTLLIEATLIGDGRPPGARRRFAFESLVGFDAERWAALKAERTPRQPLRIEGADRVGGAIRTARENLGRARLQGRVHLHKRGVEETPAAAGPGLILTNPPWGRRLGGEDPSPRWAEWSALLRQRRPAWRVAVLAPTAALAEAFGCSRRLWQARHGGLSIGVYSD